MKLLLNIFFVYHKLGLTALKNYFIQKRNIFLRYLRFTRFIGMYVQHMGNDNMYLINIFVFFSLSVSCDLGPPTRKEHGV
jgi:hypothetical protein